MSKHSAPVEVGQRACEEFNRYANESGLTIQQASEKIGVERKASTLWSNGGSPSASALCRLAAVGADVQYIITGKRTPPPVVHAHWCSEDGRCSNCGGSLSDIMDSDSYFAIGFDIKDVAACPWCGAKMDEEEL